MPTTKKRVNVTVDNDVLESLEYLKEINDEPSLAAVIMNLTKQALELQEDIFLANIANQRSKEDTVSHDDIWS